MYFQKALKCKNKTYRKPKAGFLQVKKKSKQTGNFESRKIIFVNLFEFQDRSVLLIGKLNT